MTPLLLLVPAALAASAAAQPFIELDISSSVMTGPEEVQTRTKIVIDAGAPAFGPDANPIVDASVLATFRNPDTPPGIASLSRREYEFEFNQLDPPLLQIGLDNGVPRFTITLTDDFSYLVSFSIIGTRPELTAPIDTLPDQLEDYLVDLTLEDAAVSVVAFSTEWSTEAIEYVSLGSVTERIGAIEYSVRYVLDPNASDVCPLDFDNNGTYDFADVSEFLRLFARGCP